MTAKKNEMNNTEKFVPGIGRKETFIDDDELGISNIPLCTEPWESYYILRRGIMPCCYGSQPIAPLSEWATAWNSPKLQEIRKHLSQGRLSPYCRESFACPIVQKFFEERRKKSVLSSLSPSQRYPLFRFLNRLFFRLPRKIYRALRYR